MPAHWFCAAARGKAGKRSAPWAVAVQRPDQTGESAGPLAAVAVQGGAVRLKPADQESHGQVVQLAVGRAQGRAQGESAPVKDGLKFAERIESSLTVIVAEAACTGSAEGQVLNRDVHQRVID